MTTLRLLPILLFATSSLLVLKVVGLATGSGSFAIGPSVAIAAGGGGDHGGGEGGHGAAKPADAESIEDPILLGEPLDLAKEAAALAKAQEKAGHGGGHGEAAAGGHGEAPAGGHGEAPAGGDHGAPAAGDHGAAPAAGEHGAAPAEGDHAAAPAAGDHGAAPAEGDHGAAPAAGDHGAAPAAGDHGAAPAGDDHAAPAAGGHDAGGHGGGPKLPPGVSTTRPEEYQPPGLESEKAVLEALSTRRKTLDDREKDLDLRMKLLQAAEQKLQQRVDELKSIQDQLGQVPGAGGDGGAAGAAPGAAGDGGAAAAAEPETEQMKSLVAMYEAMKPKSAAEVFDTLDLPVLVAIARKMNPRKLSPILAAMQPSHAAKVTIALAGDQGPRQIVIRNMEESALPPAARYVEPPPDLPALELAPVPGTADPLALPKIGPAPSG